MNDRVMDGGSEERGVYGLDNGCTGTVTAGVDVHVACLGDPADHLAAGDVGVRRVGEPSRMELKTPIVRCRRVQARNDVVLQNGADGVALIVRKGGADRGVGDLSEGVVVGSEDGDVLLEGQVGVEVAVAGEEGGELGEVGVGLEERGEV